MLNRRVTRSSSRAIVATNVNVATAPATQADNEKPTIDNQSAARTTRSGRVLGQITSTAKKLIGGRRGRKATTLPDVVEDDVGPNDVSVPTPNHRSEGGPALAPTVAAPRRSARQVSATVDVKKELIEAALPPAPPRAPRKRAPPKKAVTTSKAAKAKVAPTRAAKGKDKAVPVEQERVPSPPSVEVEEQLAVPSGNSVTSPIVIDPDETSAPVAGPSRLAARSFRRTEADLDALTQSLWKMNDTVLSDETCYSSHAAVPYRPRFNLATSRKKTLTVFNLFKPAVRLLRVQEQPAVPGADSGCATPRLIPSDEVEAQKVDDDDIVLPNLDNTKLESEHQKPNYDPIIFDAVPNGEREPDAVAKRHPIPGAQIISRQDAHFFDKRGYPIPGRSHPTFRADTIGEQVATILKESKEPPYPDNWHGPMFELEVEQTTPRQVRPGTMISRQNAINLGHPEAGPSGLPPASPDELEYGDLVEPRVATSAIESTSAHSSGSNGQKSECGVAVKPGTKTKTKKKKASATLRRYDDAIVPSEPTSSSTPPVANVAPAKSGVKPKSMPLRRHALEIFDVPASAAKAQPEPATAEPALSAITPSVKDAASHGDTPTPAAPRRGAPLRRHALEFFEIVEAEGGLQSSNADTARSTSGSDTVESSISNSVLEATGQSADAAGPSTSKGPAVRPGHELKRQNAYVFDTAGKKLATGTEDLKLGEYVEVPIGMMAASRLKMMEADQKAALAAGPLESQSNVADLFQPATNPKTMPSTETATFTKVPSASRLGALAVPRVGKSFAFSTQPENLAGAATSQSNSASRTMPPTETRATLTKAPPASRLGALTVPRVGTSFAFSTKTSQQNLNTQAANADKGKGKAPASVSVQDAQVTPSAVDKGKGKARAVDPTAAEPLPPAHPPSQDKGKGKKRTRESDGDDVVVVMDTRALPSEPSEPSTSTTPDYTYIKGLYRIDVTMITLPFLPIPITKRRRTSETGVEVRICVEDPSEQQQRLNTGSAAHAEKRPRETFEDGAPGSSQTEDSDAPPAKKARKDSQ